MLSWDNYGSALYNYPYGGTICQIRCRLEGIKSKSDFFETDNVGYGFDYMPTEPEMTPFYNKNICYKKAQAFIYTNDMDPVITSFAT